MQFPEQEQLKCPRCDSLNTKFCYYNNYNLSQPRHFCKDCRRYWTKGGTLRNIPVGGSSRKNAKPRSPAAQQQQQQGAAASSLGSGSVVQNPSSILEPVPTNTAGVVDEVGTGSGDVPPHVESFSSLLGVTTDGEFGNLDDGSGQGSLSGYLMSGSGGNCWGNSSNIGWTDLAVYTPSSKLQ